MGTRLPFSSKRPGPTAMTVPSCGFSLAVSGMTRPEAVVVSASFAWTRIRSSSGLIATLVAVVTGIPSWGIWLSLARAGERRLGFGPEGRLAARRPNPWRRQQVRLVLPDRPVVAGAGTAGRRLGLDPEDRLGPEVESLALAPSVREC